MLLYTSLILAIVQFTGVFLFVLFCFCLFFLVAFDTCTLDYRVVCLFVYLQLQEQFFSYLAVVTIPGDRAANFGLCSALRLLSREGSLSCHTYCDIGPRFIRSHPKDRHPRPTVGFEPPTQESSDHCARHSNHCATYIHMYTSSYSKTNHIVITLHYHFTY
jgi:hypothetical protein